MSPPGNTADQCPTSALQGTRLLPGKVCQEGKNNNLHRSCYKNSWHPYKVTENKKLRRGIIFPEMLNVPDCKIGFHAEIHKPSIIKFTNPSQKENNFFYNFLISVQNKTGSKKSVVLLFDDT